MSELLSYKGILPTLGEDAYVAPGAQVIGDVVLGAGASVWFNSVVRGDVMPIRIGDRTNIQDLSVLHVSSDTFPTTIASPRSITSSRRAGVITHPWSSSLSHRQNTRPTMPKYSTR